MRNQSMQRFLIPAIKLRKPLDREMLIGYFITN